MKCCQPTGKVREFDLVWSVVTLDSVCKQNGLVEEESGFINF